MDMNKTFQGQPLAQGSSLYGPQEGYLQDLWSGAQGLFDQQGNQGNMAQRLMYGHQQTPGFLEQMQGMIGGMGDNPFMQQLQNSAANPYQGVGQQKKLLGDAISQFSGRQMGAAEQFGIGAGQFGGRTGVAKGIIGESATQAFAQGYGSILEQARARSQQASVYGQQFTNQSAQIGLGGMQQMLGQAMQPFQAPWQRHQQMQGIIGSPIVLAGGQEMGGGLLSGGMGDMASSFGF